MNRALRQAMRTSRTVRPLPGNLPHIFAAEKVIAGMDAGAHTELLRQLPAQPKDGFFRLWHGLALQQQGKAKEACAELLAAGDLGCNHWRVGWYLAQAARHAGQLDLVDEACAAVLRSNPQFWFAREFPKHARGYYAQNGQDAVIERFFAEQPPRAKVFVEVGAFDGTHYSNVRRLVERHGWSGLAIEPVQKNFKKLVQSYANAPVRCVRAAVSNTEGELDIHVSTYPHLPDWGSDVASVSGAGNARWQREYGAQWTTEKVPARKLTAILDEAGLQQIDLLSVDAEGHDLQVLQSLEFDRFAPQLIVVEYGERRDAIARFLAERGYSMLLDNQQDLFLAHLHHAADASLHLPPTRNFTGLSGSPGYEEIQQEVEHHLHELIQKPADCVERIVIVGGYLGFEVRSFLQHYPRAEIHIFEPSRRYFSRLRETFAQEPRVRCHPLAVGEQAGTAAFHEGTLDGVGSLLALKASRDNQTWLPEGLAAAEAYSVDVVTLDSLSELQGKPIDLLWCDVQGAELQVLRGAEKTLRRCQALFLEVATTQTTYEGQCLLRDLRAELAVSGFYLAGIGLCPTGNGTGNSLWLPTARPKADGTIQTAGEPAAFNVTESVPSAATPSSTTRPELPPALEITTVVGCRMACAHCPQARLVRRYGERSNARKLSLESFKRCLATVSAEVDIHFSGMAEPWLNEACTEMLLHAVQKGHRVDVFSTLVGMSEADWDRIKGLEFGAFVLHVPDAANHAKIPVTPDYLRLLDRVVNTDISVRDKHRHKFSCHGPVHPQVAPIIGSKLPVDPWLIDRAGNVQRADLRACWHEGPIQCGSSGRALNRNVLLPDGTVLLCCMDYNLDHPLGNLLTMKYADLFTSEEALEVRRGLDDPRIPILCRRCSVATARNGKETRPAQTKVDSAANHANRPASGGTERIELSRITAADGHGAETNPQRFVPPTAPAPGISADRLARIVGLVPARNEGRRIESCLRALARYTDAIVYLDDCSDDNTVEIVQSLAAECRIERVLRKDRWHRDEPGDRNALLQAGREIGGTHFVVLDADEAFTANCADHGFLRRLILGLLPGDRLALHWIQLWRGVEFYRFDDSVWTWNLKDFAFCDDGRCAYSSGFIHTSRAPGDLAGQRRVVPGYAHGVLHFQFTHWRNLLVKQAWYRCLERIRDPQKQARTINDLYAPSKDETRLGVRRVPEAWLAGYKELDTLVLTQPDSWRETQVLEWFRERGQEFFRDLDIWDVNWGRPDETLVPSAAFTAACAAAPAASALDSRRQAEPHLREAGAAFERGDLSAARAGLQEALKHQPDSHELTTALGNVLFLLGDTDAARWEFIRATALAPDSVPAHVHLAVAASKLGRAEELETALHCALELDPRNFDALKLLADQHLQQGRHADALDTYRLCVQVKRNDVPTLLGLGKCCFEVGQLEAARDAYEDILRLDSSHALARANLEAMVQRLRSAAPAVQVTDAGGPYLVSAIVSTCNAERFLRGCLEDLLAQTIAAQIEIIVIDSGSDENERGILAEYQQRHSNIVYQRTARESLYAAWNHAVEIARGQYLTSANADDRHCRHALERMARELETRPDVALVYADVAVCENVHADFGFPELKGYFRWPDFDPVQLFRACCVGPQPLWRRELHQRHGLFDPSYRVAGDYDFWLRLARTERFVHVPEVLGLYWFSPSSVEGSSRALCDEESERARSRHWPAEWGDRPPAGGDYLVFTPALQAVEARVCAAEGRIEELRNWIQELENGKAWLEQQWKHWMATARVQQERIRQLEERLHQPNPVPPARCL